MAEPSSEIYRRRLALAGGVLVLVLLLTIFVVPALRSTPSAKRAGSPVEPTVTTPVQGATDQAPPPAPQLAPIGRAEVLAAAAAAAAAHSAGTPAGPDAGLLGRRFRLKVPFGCSGPSAPASRGLAGYEYDETSRTVRLRAQPQVWTGSGLATATAVPGLAEIEAVEGFWLARPWLTTDGCPAHPDPAPAAVQPKTVDGQPAATAPVAPLAAETVGLAAFYRNGGSRILRRGERPYQAVQKLPPEADGPPAGGYRLVLEGRISGYGPEGPAVRCEGRDPNRRPTCLLAVDFDYVAFEDPTDGSIIAEWRG